MIKSFVKVFFVLKVLDLILDFYLIKFFIETEVVQILTDGP